MTIEEKRIMMISYINQLDEFVLDEMLSDYVGIDPDKL